MVSTVSTNGKSITNKVGKLKPSSGAGNADLFYRNFLDNYEKITKEFQSFVDKSMKLQSKITKFTEEKE
jgi:hypothetical protein